MDRILFLVFGVLSTLALAFGVLSVYKAVKSARKKDGELAMAFWSIGALAGLTFAGMCWAYFLIPIIVAHLFP
ncbi:MAG TPA: hypothetical protein VMM57_07145 [Bacteroidota bacterium]|nr:hypothetical protein [Bacteroidota bacterium]